MKRKIFTLALATLLLTCVCALGGCSGKKVIDLEDYVSVRFSGYNGDGSASVVIDTDAMLPLIEDQNSPEMIASSFTAEEIKNNGKLSNGDTIGVTVKFNEKMMENAKLNVQNPTLSFTVSGLKEKQLLDLFSNVEFSCEGTSPECTAELKYTNDTGLDMRDWFTWKSSGGKSGSKADISNAQFEDGEVITVTIADKILEELRKEHIIEVITKDYTVKADGRYILTAADLTDEYRSEIDKIAEGLVNEKVDEIYNKKDRDARYNLLSQVSGLSVGKLYAGCSDQIKKLEITQLNSAYVGVGDKNQKFIYYIYDAKVSYYMKDFFTVYDDEKDCVLIVRISGSKITPEGVMYSDWAFGSAKDFNSAYNSYITSNFEKLP